MIKSTNLVSVLIGMRNRADQTIEVIKDLELQSFQDFNIIIFDDVSDISEIEKIKRIKNDKIIIHSNPGPWKFEGDLKWNTHLKLAIKQKSKYVCNIHNDMKINNIDLLNKFVDYMEKNENCGAVGPTIINGAGIKTQGRNVPFRRRMGKEYPLNECYFVRIQCFIDMGLMPEKFIYYGSEYYTFNWLRDNGYSQKVIEEVSIIHYGGGTSTAYQNKKDYFRPRTSILIMKLFCKEDTFKEKLKYFYEELGEPRLKMINFIKNFQFFSLIRTLLYLFIGTIAGLVIPIKLNKPYKIEESN